MLRLIALIALLAGALAAAELRFIITNDAGATTVDVKLQTTDAVLQALDEWRLSQIISPSYRRPDGTVMPVKYRFPTPEAMWETLIARIVRAAVREYAPTIRQKRQALETAKKELEQAERNLIRRPVRRPAGRRGTP